MNANTRFLRCEDMLEAEVNDEIVALDVARGQCFGMNEVASEVWRMLAEPRSVNEICRDLCAGYDVDASTCQAQVQQLISELRDEGLVKEIID